MLDSLDKSIFQLLKVDGRRTNASLAKELGVTQNTVSRRLSHLLKENIFKITVFVDPTKLDFPFAVLIALEANYHDIDNAVDFFIRQEPVARVSITTGRFNIMVTAYFQSIYHFSTFRTNELTHLRGVKSLEIFPLLHEGIHSDPQSTPLDTKDIEMIQVLQDHGPMSLIALSKRLSLHRITARRKLDALIDNGYIRIQAMLLDHQSGWINRGAVGIKANHSEIAKISDQLKVYDEIVWLSLTTGRFDILASIEAENIERIYQIVDYQISELSGVIHCELFISNHMKLGPQWLFRYEKPTVA